MKINRAYELQGDEGLRILGEDPAEQLPDQTCVEVAGEDTSADAKLLATGWR